MIDSSFDCSFNTGIFVESLGESTPLLASGGTYAWMTFTFGVDGHWEVTAKALDRVSREGAGRPFHANAITLLQDASQDPDFYEFAHPEAHAQTNNDDDGRTSTGPWQQKWVDWVRDRLGRSLTAAQSGRRDEALYWLGYALHGVEDVAPHAGRTNAEHSYNASQKASPDENKSAIQHSEHLAYLVLREMRIHFGACWEWLGNHQGVPKLTGDAKQRLVGKWDFAPSVCFAYRGLAEKYQQLPIRDQVRWCQPTQCESLLKPILVGLPSLSGACGGT